ncbi:MAG TPA: hypothetical protein VEU94_06075, partial [Terriglobales bacterium]|nr:hypothetical protein [Terriglobales bacterium]
MKLHFGTAMGVALICAMSTIVGAQAQVGNLYVGICDGSLQNTQQDEVDVYSPTGQFVTAFHGPTQNACLTGMAFDGADHFHIISARFQTQSW